LNSGGVGSLIVDVVGGFEGGLGGVIGSLNLHVSRSKLF
jgi:hypothetical protein